MAVPWEVNDEFLRFAIFALVVLIWGADRISSLILYQHGNMFL